MHVRRKRKTFRRSNDRWNFNDSVSHSARKEPGRNPVLFSGSALSSPETHLCTCVVRGRGEPPPRLTEELSERNILHHSFPPCLGQCTRHSVTWCNVRAAGRLAAQVWVGVCVCVCCCRRRTAAPSLLFQENHSSFSTVLFIGLLEYSFPFVSRYFWTAQGQNFDMEASHGHVCDTFSAHCGSTSLFLWCVGSGLLACSSFPQQLLSRDLCNTFIPISAFFFYACR